MNKNKLTNKDLHRKLNVLKEKFNELSSLKTECNNKISSIKLSGQEFLKQLNSEYKSNHNLAFLSNPAARDKFVSFVDKSISNGEDINLDYIIDYINNIEYNTLDEFEYNFDDNGVDKLTDMLDRYKYMLNEFDSVEIEEGSNCLYQDTNLIDFTIFNTIDKGFRIYKDYGISRNIKQNSAGIYMVVFSIINIENKPFVIYNYIKYSNVFSNLLHSYFCIESESKTVSDNISVGRDYLFVLHDSLKYDEKRYINNNESRSYLEKGFFSTNFVDMCKVIFKGRPIFLHTDSMCNFIKLGRNREIFDFLVEVLNKQKYYNNTRQHELVFKLLSSWLSKPDFIKYNLLNRVVFVTKDLNLLIEKLKLFFDGRVSQGFQKWRGQSSCLSNIIHTLDKDFRCSMYRHSVLHSNIHIDLWGKTLPRNKFSFRNIHFNIGFVRWYSTKPEVKDIKGRKVIAKKYKKPTFYSEIDRELIYNISEYINNSPINKDTQLKLENSLYENAYYSFTEKLFKSDKPLIDYGIINKKISNLLIENREVLVEYINKYRKLRFLKEPEKTSEKIQYLMKNLFRELKNEYIISVIYGRLFKIISTYDIASEFNKALNIFIDIGGDIIGNYYYSLYINQKNKSQNTNYKLSNWKKENEDIISKYSEITKAEIGGKIISWLKDMDLIEMQLITKGKKERDNIIVPTQRVLNLLDKEKKIKVLPRRLPMIIKPNKYSRIVDKNNIKEELGGYLLNNEKYVDPLIIPKWNFEKPTLIKNDNLVYDLVNNLNSVGFKINKDVFNFINVYGSKYNLIINSSHNHPFSNKEKLTKSEYIQLSSYISKKNLQDNILIIAEMYLDNHEFFLPTRLDSRGRLYCISDSLNYQSNELAKSLLLFSNNEKVYKHDKDAINYLKAYGANCYGNKLEKMSWKNRCKWVEDNREKIANFENGKLIEKAEKKLLFIAFCFEYKKYLKSINNENDYFETSLPIQLDATCNGYQHLSLLSLDYSLAKQLNLTKSSSEHKPKDFYNFTAVKLISYFKNKLDSNNISKQEKDIYTRFSNLAIARSIVKKAIMTIPYNVSYFTIIDYLKSSFNLKDNIYYYTEDNSIILKDTDFPIIAKGLKTVLFDDRFKLKKLLKYLNDTAKVVTCLGLAIPWGTPNTGVTIQQSYLDTKEERLKVFAYTNKTFKIKVVNKSKYNIRKQRVSFLPNLIHSLDAASLALLISYYFNDTTFSQKNIYTIHDCFAVTANNVKNLIYLLCYVYQKIYTEKNYLREFDENMRKYIKFNCNKSINFNDKNLIITNQDKSVILQYPSVEDVLGVKHNTDTLIRESTYIIN